MAERRERKPKYNEGYDDAIEHVLTLLEVGLDAYPRRPSEAVLGRIMDRQTAEAILGVVTRYLDQCQRLAAVADEVRG
jgi:hypothetical protein